MIGLDILEIKIKDGKFVSSNNVNVEEFSDTYVRGNGWQCFIKVNGAIKCETISQENADMQQTKYFIIYPNGSGQLKYRKNEEPPIHLRKRYVVPKGCSIKNGTIGLSSGTIEERYAYFRHEELQNFLEQYGINRIKKADPNDVYQGYLVYNDSENYYSTIITDGEEVIINDPSEIEKLSKNFSTSDDFIIRSEKIIVTNATWALKVVRKRKGEEVYVYRVLYTLENFKNINIPSNYKVK